MKPSEVLKLIVAKIKSGDPRSILIQGPPGGGKTELGSQAAALCGIAFRSVHAPLSQPEDYGLPVMSADRTSITFAVPTDILPFIGTDCPDAGILLFDEILQCSPAMQCILANILQTKELHGRKLKPNWYCLGTGNRQSDRSGAGPVLRQLSDRVKIVELETDTDDWTQWALNNNVRTEVISFIRYRPELLSNFDPSKTKSATPRGWVQGVSRELGNVPSELEFESIKGDVGEGPAAEFCAFLKVYRKLPNPDAILLNSDKADIPGPKELDVMYALIGALTSRVTAQNFDRALKYVRRLPAEFSVLFVKLATTKNADLLQTKGFIDWASKEGAELLT